MAIEDFRQLWVYQSGFEGAMRIFERTKTWPKEEQYAMTDQIRRSSRSVYANIGSVCANIGEAWFKRLYPRHFVSKLSDAGSEAIETLVWIELALTCGYLSEDEATDLSSQYRIIVGGLAKMMARPEQWCIPTDRIREELSDYHIDSSSSLPS